MMQPADHREGDDVSPVGGLALAGFGGVLVEPEVGPVCGKLGLTRQQADETVAMAISAFVFASVTISFRRACAVMVLR